MTVVIDSGIWISAFQFNGSSLRAVEGVFRHDSFAICAEIVGEIRKALVGKFGRRDQEASGQLSRYLAGVAWIDVIGNLHGICRDPKDV